LPLSSIFGKKIKINVKLTVMLIIVAIRCYIIMGISNEQYRLRVGLFTSNFGHNTKILPPSEVLCILLFFFSHRKINALRVIVFIHFIIDLSVLKKCLKNTTNMTKVDKSAPSLPNKPTVDSKLTKEYIFVIFNVKLPDQSCPYPQYLEKR
jgi:hypothetical protein